MHFFHLSLSLGLLSTIRAAPVVEERQAADPTVTISNGVIIGTATAIANQPSVTPAKSYLGIPYAKPPTGDLRFAPPEPATPWTSPLQAQTLPPACLQQFPTGGAGERTKRFFNNPNFPPPAESEDCLYLNVFAPQDASPSNNKAVMFWLYGGNNQFGTASLVYYDGSSLAANEDVVVVAINYRTNFFGFSNSPEIAFGKQNSAYLDQRLALKWVQDNIRQFGGDPTRVTLFGESAGGHDIKQLLANPPNPRPFRAAIMQSQNQLATGNGLLNYAQVASHFGCSTATSTLACLREVPATDLQSYVTDQGLSFFEVVGDGTSVGKQSLASIASGKFANVPILIGSNADEATVFVELLGIDNNTPLNQTLAMNGLGFGISDLTLGVLYPTLIGTGKALISRVLTDLLFTCSTQTLSSAIQLAGGRSIWRYRYEGDFPNLQLFPNAGAYHTSEIPSVWGTYPLDNEFGAATRDQIALSKYMQGVWSDFAKDPTKGAPWPKLGSALGRELGVLGGKNVPGGVQIKSLLSSDLPCAVFSPLLIAAGQAY